MAGKLLMLNPKRRTKKRAAAKAPSYVKIIQREKPNRKRLTAKRRTITVRRNPSPRMSGKAGNLVKQAVMPSLVSSMGALGLDVLMGYASTKLPVNLQSGVAGAAVKMAGAVALGMAAEKLKGKEFGKQVMIGGMTVTLHQVLKSQVQAMMPNVPLGVYSDSNGLGVYSNDLGNMGVQGLGFYSPAISSDANLGNYEFVSYDQFDDAGFDDNGNFNFLQ